MTTQIENTGEIFAYLRRSTRGKNIDRQDEILEKYNIPDENVFEEKISATVDNRPELDKLKSRLQKVDTVYIESLSRLGRSTKDLFNLIEWFNEKGVRLVSLKEGIDTNSADGQLLTSFFSIMAQFERECRSEQTYEGIKAAKEDRGVVGGRPRIKQKYIDQALQMYDSRNFKVDDILKATNMTRSTFYIYKKLRDENAENKTNSEQTSEN